jgi:hypothetical protein
MMQWLQDLLREEGLVPSDSPNAGLRSKLLQQADRMLQVLHTYKTEQALDGAVSKYWWSPQSVDGQRRIVMRYAGKAVEGSAVYVNNTLDDVRDAITKMRRAVEKSTDAAWAAEEERRRKK